MIHIRSPARLPVFIVAIGKVCGKGVKTRSRPLSNEMDDQLGIEQSSNLVSRAHPAVLYDYVDLPGAASSLTQNALELRQ